MSKSKRKLAAIARHAESILAYSRPPCGFRREDGWLCVLERGHDDAHVYHTDLYPYPEPPHRCAAVELLKRIATEENVQTIVEAAEFARWWFGDDYTTKPQYQSLIALARVLADHRRDGVA